MKSENHGRIRGSTRTRAAICLAGLGAGLALLIGALSAGASAGTAVSITSGSMNVGQTTTLTASINLAAADAAFHGFDITVTWDTSVATATYPGDVAVSSAFGEVFSPSSSAGAIEIVGSAFGTANACPATGQACTLFTITFHGATVGSTNVNMSGDLSGIGVTITGTFGSGTITVGSGSATSTNTTTTTTTTTTSTATPTPTGTPHPSGYRLVIPEVAKDGTS